MNPIISTENVCKVFQSGGETLRILNDVNISVEPSTLNILRGRSGSGKTTLINLLGALDMPSKGKIVIENKDICVLSRSQRDEIRRTEMGFVFQAVALISTMTAFENVEFALKVAGNADKSSKKRVEECLEAVGLGKRMNHMTNELSGGEQQRVAIARAIAHRPKILFADEPTAALDTHMGIQVMKLFRELIQKEKITLIMTTHDPNMIELADRVFDLDDGQVVYIR